MKRQVMRIVRLAIDFEQLTLPSASFNQMAFVNIDTSFSLLYMFLVIVIRVLTAVVAFVAMVKVLQSNYRRYTTTTT